MSNKIFYFAAVTIIIIFGMIGNFSYLNWGTPSIEKNRLLFESEAESKKWVPIMIELRNKYYSGLRQMFTPNTPIKPLFQDIFLYHQKNPLFSELPREQVIDRMRGYMLGVINQEEQHVLAKLSKIKLQKLDFDFSTPFFYGGFFYLLSGFSLIIGKVLGTITLNPNAQYYFTHPEEIQRMYMILRLVGSFSIFFIVLLMITNALQTQNRWMNILSAAFFTTIPFLVPMGHRTTTHSLSMFLCFLGFAMGWRFTLTQRAQELIGASLFLGLCAASCIPHLVIGILIPLIILESNGWNFKQLFKEPKLYIGSFVFFFIFMIFNFYIFTNYAVFNRTILGIEIYMQNYGETYGKLKLSKWIPFLKDMFSNQIHLSILPLFILGGVIALIRKEKFFRITFLFTLFLLLANLSTTRHLGINTRILPLIAILCARGSFHLLEFRPKYLKILAGGYIFTSLTLSTLQSCFYLSMLKEPSHLTLAGSWINQHISKGESIGVVGGQIASANFPPIHFLDYKMINFPDPTLKFSLSRTQLPNYVVANQDINPIIELNYEKVMSWKKPQRFLGISFKSDWVASGNIDIFIYKKI